MIVKGIPHFQTVLCIIGRDNRPIFQVMGRESRPFKLLVERGVSSFKKECHERIRTSLPLSVKNADHQEKSTKNTEHKTRGSLLFLMIMNPVFSLPLQDTLLHQAPSRPFLLFHLEWNVLKNCFGVTQGRIEGTKETRKPSFLDAFNDIHN